MSNGYGANAYAKTQVSTTTSQKELIVMAYDGILKFLRQGREYIEQNDYEQKHVHLCKARAVIEELAATLDRKKGGVIADNLWNLYMYFMQRIGEANLKHTVAPIDEILTPIENLREGWANMEVPKDDAKAQALDRKVVDQQSSHLTFTG